MDREAINRLVKEKEDLKLKLEGLQDEHKDLLHFYCERLNRVSELKLDCESIQRYLLGSNYEFCVYFVNNIFRSVYENSIGDVKYIRSVDSNSKGLLWYHWFFKVESYFPWHFDKENGISANISETREVCSQIRINASPEVMKCTIVKLNDEGMRNRYWDFDSLQYAEGWYNKEKNVMAKLEEDTTTASPQWVLYLCKYPDIYQFSKFEISDLQKNQSQLMLDDPGFEPIKKRTIRY